MIDKMIDDKTIEKETKIKFNNIESYLKEHENKQMLRFITCGSVDDGKSTLIGRLLHDSKMIFEDQLAAIKCDSKKSGTTDGEFDLALIVDGLQSEREQGITIDVAYRYFSTDKKKFIIADSPGHEQYTRNMVTGASYANLAIILIDARGGVQTQTKRHSFITKLLGIKHFIIGINKMDLVDFSEDRFEEIKKDYLEFASEIEMPNDLTLIPISALNGDNIVNLSPKSPWYKGHSLMHILESIDIASDINLENFRMPIQYVNRPNLDFRGFCGTLSSGTIGVGDAITVLPSAKSSTVKEIITYDGKLDFACEKQAITITLNDEIDISRGNILVKSLEQADVASVLDVNIVWMSEEALLKDKLYNIKRASTVTAGRIKAFYYKINVNTLKRENTKKLELNEIGYARLSLDHRIAFDPYEQIKTMGSFVIIDRITNNTVGAGMITGKSVISTDKTPSVYVPNEYSEFEKELNALLKRYFPKWNKKEILKEIYKDKKALKETKAQRIERIKIEKNGLDVIKDICVYSFMGTPIDPEDIDRFKWYGLHVQNKNMQDENDKTLYFMLRVRIIHGQLNLTQIGTIADIANKFARGTAAFTTRQNIQFYFIQIKDIPEIFKKLSSVGLSTVFAAGDVPRNVVSCPVNGLDHEQICDVRDIVYEVNKFLVGNKNFENLPRKFKVSISGCRKHCTNHEIHDVSFNAVNISKSEVSFDVSVGGGLGSNKRVATHIGYVNSWQILPVVEGIAEIFRDYGERTNRTKARLGHIIEKWGIEKFTRVLFAKLDFQLGKTKIREYTPYARREHLGINKSTVEGQSYIGCAVSSGRLGGKGFFNLLSVLKKYHASTIKITPSQNFIILDAKTKETKDMVAELERVGIDANPSTFKLRNVSCTGLNFCNFAISETKQLANKIISHLENKFPGFTEPISISVNGCPHSCAHPHIVDIGLSGCKVKHENSSVSGFALIIGGHLEGSSSRFGVKTGLKFIPDDAPKIIENLINEYKTSDFKNIQDFLKHKAFEKNHRALE